jgi:hypothetical protein
MGRALYRLSALKVGGDNRQEQKLNISAFYSYDSCSFICCIETDAPPVYPPKVHFTRRPTINFYI